MALIKSKSKLQKLGQIEGLEVLSLAEKMYLFLPTAGTNRVIISAHGGRSKTTRDFRVPTDTILRFYSEDTNTVLDPGFNDFYRKEAAPKEILSEGEPCYDYVLSKYQGRHGNKKETYSSIAKIISDTAKLRNSLLTDAGKTNNAKLKEKLLAGASREKLAAVLTIRNRIFQADVNLSYAIEQVRAAAPQIQLFDCLFCRWLSGGKDDAVPLISRF